MGLFVDLFVSNCIAWLREGLDYVLPRISSVLLEEHFIALFSHLNQLEYAVNKVVSI
jgi:hypothetical protein